MMSLVLMLAASGAPSDMDAARKYVAHELSAERQMLCRDNPALRMECDSLTLASVAVGGSGWRNRAGLEEAGTGGRSWGVHANGSQRRGGYLVWGGAGYSSGVTQGTRWCESEPLLKGFPYVMADSTGGDLQREEYSFRGGVSSARDRWVWGATGGYTATLSYRGVDPRPRTLGGVLHLRAGAGTKVENSLMPRGRVAVWGEYRGMNQSTEMMFVSETGESKIFHLTGLGGDYKRFSGVGKESLTRCGTWQAGVDAVNILGAIDLSASGGETGAEYIIPDLNGVPMGDVTSRHGALALSWKRDLAACRLQLTADAGMETLSGSENIFGDPQSGCYPQVGSQTGYVSGYDFARIAASIVNAGHWSWVVDARWDSWSAERVMPDRGMLIKSIGCSTLLSLWLPWSSIGSGGGLMLRAGATAGKPYGYHLDAEQPADVGDADTRSLLEKLHRDFRFMTLAAQSYRAQCEWVIPVQRGDAVSVGAGCWSTFNGGALSSLGIRGELKYLF